MWTADVWDVACTVTLFSHEWLFCQQENSVSGNLLACLEKQFTRRQNWTIELWGIKKMVFQLSRAKCKVTQSWWGLSGVCVRVCGCVCVWVWGGGVKGCCCHILSALWNRNPGGIPDSHLAVVFLCDISHTQRCTRWNFHMHKNQARTHFYEDTPGFSLEGIQQPLFIWIINIWFAVFCVLYAFSLAYCVLWKQSHLVLLIFVLSSAVK